jgi:hypothetical protein
MPSFWQSNPLVPTWTETLKMKVYGEHPGCYEANPPKVLLNRPPGLVVRKATVEDIEDIEEVPTFWTQWFRSPGSCSICIVPEWIVKESVLSNRWILLVARQDGKLIGTIVKRILQNLKVHTAFWKEGAIIDYFCIHPARESVA